MFAASIGGKQSIGSPVTFPEPLKSKLKSVNEYVQGFQKYCELAELLELSLADITVRLSEGYYDGFTREELSRMIRALFSDSAKRNGVLGMSRMLSGAGNYF
jgi:hypothetical protein